MRRWGLPLAIVSAVCFGFSGVAAKALNQAGLSPLEAVWIRLAGAAIVLFVLLGLFRPASLRVPRRLWGLVFVYAAVAVVGTQALYFSAVSRLPVGIALLVEYLAPVLVLVWVRFIRRRPVPLTAALGAVLAVLGLAFVVEVWSGLRLDALGLVFALTAAACLAGYFVLSDATVGVDPLGLVAWGMAGGSLLLAPVVGPWRMDWTLMTSTASVNGWRLPVIVLVAWLVVVSTVIAYGAGVVSVRLLSAAVASVIATSEVLITVLVAWVVLAEQLSVFQLAGGAVLLVGALLAQRATVRQSPAEPVEPRAAVQVGP